MSGMPSDVRKSLEESGVKFDDQGNIIEDEFLDNQFSEDEDELEDEEVEEDVEEEIEEVEEDLEDDDDDDEDEDELEEEEPEVKSKSKKKVKADPSGWSLTPKEAVPAKEEKVDISAIMQKIEDLQSSIAQPAPSTDGQEPTPVLDNSPESAAIEELKAEAKRFKQMSMQRLAADLEREVNRRFSDRGVKYKDIINSVEWEQFLKKSMYGQPINKFYVTAIENSDWDTMVSVFDGFKENYFPEKVEEKSAKKKKLEDLAVPQNSKTNRKPKRRSKYDFNASDYSNKLELMTRGKVTPQEFYDFEAKFEKAEKLGRVNSAA